MPNLDPEKVGNSITWTGIYRNDGSLSQPVYDLMTEVMPLACVDVIPIDISESGLMRMGTITRAIGPETGKLALLGGRIRKDETIKDAIGRHLNDSFGDDRFDFHEGNDESSPFYVGQFMHMPHTPDRQYDPGKHTVTQTYAIDIDGPTTIQNEASGFKWISIDEIPSEAAYGHHISLQKAAEFLVRVHPAFH